MKHLASYRLVRCPRLTIVAALIFRSLVAFGQTPVLSDSATMDVAQASALKSAKKLGKSLRSAQSLFDRGHYKMARNWFQHVLEDHPDDFTARAGFQKADQAAIAAGYCSAKQEDAQDKLQEKLCQIILPQVAFDHVRLADAVEFLREECARLDKVLVPNQQVIKVAIKYPDDLPKPTASPPDAIEKVSSANPAATPDTPISISARNIPLLEAYRQVANQAGLYAKVHFDGVYLTGRDEIWPDRLITRQFDVNPVVVSSSSQTLVEPFDAKTLLEASGVTFPTGASAIYVPSSHKMTVCNTEENLDLIESCFPN